MNEDQRRFLEQLAARIPRLFEAIRLGNVKSEYIVGIRRIGSRQVRLKLVAEVVDPGANPLESHSQLRAVVVRAEIDEVELPASQRPFIPEPGDDSADKSERPGKASAENSALSRNRKSRKTGKKVFR